MDTRNIIQLFHNADLDEDSIQVLSHAYDKACRSMHDRGQPYLVSEIIAQRMIALARAGERDPDKLCASALMALGNKAVFER